MPYKVDSNETDKLVELVFAGRNTASGLDDATRMAIGLITRICLLPGRRP